MMMSPKVAAERNAGPIAVDGDDDGDSRVNNDVHAGGLAWNDESQRRELHLRTAVDPTQDRTVVSRRRPTMRNDKLHNCFT